MQQLEIECATITSSIPGLKGCDMTTLIASDRAVVRILIVDDLGLMRESLADSLARHDDFEIVGVAEDADDGITKVIELKPDLVLMDIDMPGLSCFDAIRIIRSRAPETKFIIVTAYEHDEHIEQALRAKANGFISKSRGVAYLADAIRNVTQGRIQYSPEVMSRLVIRGDEIKLDSPPKSRLGTLSPRERELLRVLARGVSLKDAAGILGISYKTADKQKASVMSKLDIHDRVELARYAIREGMVEP
jgi:DNA-binding NarL/FixJ family response regulator